MRIRDLLIIIVLVLILTACGAHKPTDRKYENTASGTEEKLILSNDENESSIVGDFQYPENPAEELRDALENTITQHKLPIKVSDVERVPFEGKERAEITLNFTGENDNMCIIFFELRYLNSELDYSLNGHDNPSFTMAFKDPDNSQDMITVLALVLQYLSPSLSDGKAKHLAEQQDTTISIDGYSQPLDIGGYQVVARYTNPRVYVRTQEFDSKFGVRVTAIKQIWGESDTSKYKKLRTRQDYSVLTSGFSPLGTGYQTKAVYADFVIKNVWHYEESIHGDYWVEVDAESMAGDLYSLRVETMNMLMDYEFGVGQRYTLYIGTGSYYGASINYAVQQTSSTKPNSIGIPYTMDYPNLDFEDPVFRIEPDGDGTVCDVCFYLVSQGAGDKFAVLKGHGIGAKQWPNDPSRDGYEFLGWFDNEERKGNPYTKDTPIYQDTNLYVKWKYVGSGGIWPRAHRGKLKGINEGGSYSVGQTLSIITDGYNLNLSKPKDQRFRWIPVYWRLSDGTSGNFSKKAPYSVDLSLGNIGEQTLYITYLEEIYDGVSWQQTEQLHEAEEVIFKVK